MTPLGAVPARLLGGRFTAVWVALAVLLVISLFIAPSSVQPRALNNLMFFAAILGLVAIGQHLVVVVGGIDLSVAPVMTLAALVFALVADDSAAGAAFGAGVAIAAAMVVGLCSGLAVTALRITPLIATLGVGAVARGVAFYVHGPASPSAVPSFFNQLATSRPIFGLFSATFLLWVLLTAAVTLILTRTVVGRRFVAVGDSGKAARAVGISVGRYRIAGYVAAAFFYAVGGLALAGVAGQPGRTLGEPFLLPSVAAVVVGGTPLGGGVGSVIATAGGTLFITHLDSLTLSLRAPTSLQLIVQGAVIAGAMALYGIASKKRRSKLLVQPPSQSAPAPSFGGSGSGGR